jgi:hypothetical protein
LRGDRRVCVQQQQRDEQPNGHAHAGLDAGSGPDRNASA